MDPTTREPRLQERFRTIIRTRHYSHRTEKSYWYWVRSFIRFHGLHHPQTMGRQEVRQFLSWLAVERNVAAATQNQALNALVFLYERVLDQPLGEITGAVRAKRPALLPVVLSHEEAIAVINALEVPYSLMASLMYGSGLRVIEAARLRVKDLDFRRHVITLRNGKGGKDRTTLLPKPLDEPLRNRIAMIRRIYFSEPEAKRIPVTLPFALARKYVGAATSLQWQWLFPSANLCRNDQGTVVRHHIHTSSVQRAVRKSATRIAINKRVGCHTFRHYVSSRTMSGSATPG